MKTGTRRIYECASCGLEFDAAPFMDDGNLGPIHSKSCYFNFYTCYLCYTPVDPLRGGAGRAVEVVSAEE